MAKILVHLVSTPKCGRCGRTLGEDTQISETQRNKVKADSVFRPVYFCRTENCSQHTKRVVIEPAEIEEMEA